MADLLRIAKRGQAEATGSVVNSDAIRFVVSNDSPDVFGDVVVQRGLQFPTERNVPALPDHDHRIGSQIGHWEDIEVSDHETRATLKLLKRGVSRVADLVRALYEGGHGLASSVYFDIERKDIEPITRTEGGRTIRTGLRYMRGLVREISLTPTPANPAAVAIGRSLGFESDELAALLRSGAGDALPPPAAAVAAPPVRRSQVMDLSEAIAAAQAAATAADEALASAAAAVDTTPASLEAVTRATAAANEAHDRVSVLRNAQNAAARAAASAAAPGQQPQPQPTPSNLLPVARVAPVTRRPQVPDVPAGTRLAMLAIAKARVHADKRELNGVIAELFPGDQALIAIGRTATGVADTTTAGWAAELVRSEVRQMLEKDLAPISVAAQLITRGRRLSFAGAQSTVIPFVTQRSTALAGAWIGEGGVIPVKAGTTSYRRVNRYKLAAITALTKELERASDPDAVATIRDMMLQDTANALDAFLLDTSAEVTGIRPAGLRNGASSSAGTAGGGQAAVTADIQDMWADMVAAGAGARPVLIVPSASLINLSMLTNALGQFVFRDDVRGGNLLGLSIVASDNVPAATAILVDAACFGAAVDPPQIDVSDQATLTMANADGTAPTQAMTTAGALGTVEQVPPDHGIHVSGHTGAAAVGFQAISLFQTWSLGIRNVLPVGWGLTQAASGVVQVKTAITW